jgi:hypothetical protein
MKNPENRNKGTVETGPKNTAACKNNGIAINLVPNNHIYNFHEPELEELRQ